MKNTLEITKKTLEKDILTIEASLKLKFLASEPFLVVKTDKIIDYISQEYEVINIVREDKISNSSRGGHHQSGTWIFKVKKKRKAPTQTSPKVETSPIEPEHTEEKLTKTSIRGRMSKIAKEKLSKNEE